MFEQQDMFVQLQMMSIFAVSKSTFISPEVDAASMKFVFPSDFAWNCMRIIVGKLRDSLGSTHNNGRKSS